MSETSQKKVYLIGVNHEVQYRRESVITTEFITYLEEQVKKYNPGLIAEECSEEALERNHLESTTVQDAATRHGIKHLLCDPDTEVRKKIGYPIREQLRKKFGPGYSIEGTDEYRRRREYEKKFWHLREQHWLEQIMPFYCDTLFICGIEHLERFGSRLEENGYEAIILDRRFDVNPHESNKE